MIKILFDHQTFSMQRYGGISRYFANIHQYIGRQPDVDSEIGILKSDNHYIKSLHAPLNNVLGKILLPTERSVHKWNKRYSKYRMLLDSYDILHPTYYHPYFLKYNKKPFVITVHDMIHELYPEYFEPDDIFARYKRICVENANHIIAISETTKNDLIQILGIEGSRITVIHHGANPTFQPEVFNPASGELPFLLYVGDRKGYKNFYRFVNAISPLLRKQPSLRLICAGGGSFQNAEIEFLTRLKIRTQVLQTNASDLDLTVLYRQALAFIYPSLYEGFGLPILEAFQNDCPIMASDIACFREVGGDAIAYFNPLDEHDILRTIEHSLYISNICAELVNKGRIQLQKYAMKDCMNKTLSVYKSISSTL